MPNNPLSEQFPNVHLNVIDDDMIQIHGSYNGIAIRGTLFNKRVSAPNGKTWAYSIRLLKHPKQWSIGSGESDRTMHSLEHVKQRVESIILDFEAN